MTTNDYVEQVVMFLEAYDLDTVDNAIEEYKKRLTTAREESTKKVADRGKWEVFNGNAKEIPEGYEWTIINNVIYIRSFENRDFIFSKIDEENERRKKLNKSAPLISKTDLSMKSTDKHCIYCGSEMAWEPICPGCRLGKLGFKGRFVCMDDMDHEFYVLREGVILPNQGEIPAVN